VRVNVRNALADARVDRHKRAFRSKRWAEYSRDALHDAEERRKQIRGNVLQGRKVFARDHQRVSRHEGRPIKERDDLLVAVDLVVRRARDYRAKDVGSDGWDRTRTG